MEVEGGVEIEFEGCSLRLRGVAWVKEVEVEGV